MYESESNNRVESKTQIPIDILKKFREFKKSIVSKTVLPWGEHCNECAIPECYQTCDLYTARNDGRCRRFIDGMVRIDRIGGISTYVIKLRFKRWSKLWAAGNTELFSIKDARKIERKDIWLGYLIRKLPLPKSQKIKFQKERARRKKNWSMSLIGKKELPNFFMIDCFNPEKKVIKITMTIFPEDKNSGYGYQKLIEMPPGFNRINIPVEDIKKFVDLHKQFGIELIPNVEEEGITLYFGIMDFVKDVAEKIKSNKTCKCVVWDLDNTIWDGILIEDGLEKIKLKKGISTILKELDRRGILLSIASKNNQEDAELAFKKFGLKQYFVCPQISWEPKGIAVKNIAEKLNIGIDTLIFIDDSEFERAQVKEFCPEVTVIDANIYESLLDLQECNVPITKESSKRRVMYQEEEKRFSTKENFDGQYFEFLRDCRIKLNISTLDLQNLQRVHELAQRTNQMNFSGNRYEMAELEKMIGNENIATYVLECEDRFGSYGIIGFCVINIKNKLMTDLMLSCRIQSKRVEHAFLTYILNKYVIKKEIDFYVNYRKTPRNTQSGKVFKDFEFKEIEEKNGITHLKYSKNWKVPDDKIIKVISL